MPELTHWVGKNEGQSFDFGKSETVAWLLKNPDAAEIIWNKAQGTGMILYDAESNTWAGVETRRRMAEGSAKTGSQCENAPTAGPEKG